ncbi:MAG: DUF4180 domain-containing protein [Candidatus Aminicenantes bacterium]|nr:DUF4180 domain-containing protein [Candidatus Aminicenantes bacterium]
MSNIKMTAKTIDGKIFMEFSPGEIRISSEQDILDLFAESYEYNTNLFLLFESNFHPDLFDLKTGLAGAVFQKIAVYHSRAAVVLDSNEKKNKRFEEYMYECNQGNQVRFFSGREKAVEWLVGT